MVAKLVAKELGCHSNQLKTPIKAQDAKIQPEETYQILKYQQLDQYLYVINYLKHLESKNDKSESGSYGNLWHNEAFLFPL